jgi:hypothetical protein
LAEKNFFFSFYECSTTENVGLMTQLTTLMVVDGDYEGFPVALLWLKLQTENIFRKNFACLKEQVPDFYVSTLLSTLRWLL